MNCCFFFYVNGIEILEIKHLYKVITETHISNADNQSMYKKDALFKRQDDIRGKSWYILHSARYSKNKLFLLSFILIIKKIIYGK